MLGPYVLIELHPFWVFHLKEDQVFRALCHNSRAIDSYMTHKQFFLLTDMNNILENIRDIKLVLKIVLKCT